MKVIKKINNNVAICIDGNGKELVAFGNGIGFPKTPYDIADIRVISRTFYGVDTGYLALINEIPEDIFEIAAKIVEYAKSVLTVELNNNIVFTLADHIHFAIIRYQRKMYMKMPIMYDIKYLYPNEMQVGENALRYINKCKRIKLSKEEAASIALHFINAESISRKTKDTSGELIEDIITIIEDFYSIKIDRNGFNHSRFVSHMQYLMQRQKVNQEILSENRRLFTTMMSEYPMVYECVVQIKDFLKREIDWDSSEEELLYLMLHINRLCARESLEENREE